VREAIPVELNQVKIQIVIASGEVAIPAQVFAVIARMIAFW
jgi:hypothetical protein